MDLIETESFQKFWSVYPKKQSKKTALASWVKNGCEIQAEKIIAHVEVRAKRDAQWLGNSKYIPMPATFLNQGRWEDEYETKDSALRKDARDRGERVAPIYTPLPEPPDCSPVEAWCNKILLKIIRRYRGLCSCGRLTPHAKDCRLRNTVIAKKRFARDLEGWVTDGGHDPKESLEVLVRTLIAQAAPDADLDYETRQIFR